MLSTKWWRHAFAVEAEAPLDVTPEQHTIVARLSREVVARGLTTPAILLLEMSRPLGFLGAQAVHFFTPLVSAVMDARSVQSFAEFLEQRGAVDHLLCEIERTLDTAETRRRGEDGP